MTNLEDLAALIATIRSRGRDIGHTKALADAIYIILDDYETRIIDHEARITALENPE